MKCRSDLHLLITTDAIGGVWQYSTDLAEGLAERGARISMALIGPDPGRTEVERISSTKGVAFHDLRLPLDWLTRSPAPIRCAAEKLAELSRQLDVNVIHLNSPILAGAASFQRPVVAVAHGCPATWWKETRRTCVDPEYQWHLQMSRDGLMAANRIVAPTQAFAKVVREAYNLPQTPLAVHNGSSPIPSARKSDRSFALVVGRLWDEAKNICVLDQAAEYTDVPIVAVGPSIGPASQQATFKNLAQTGKLSRHEIRRMLGLRPIFASSALFEPFGLSVLEAASAGCPLVLSDIPTFRELWEGAAVFVPPRDSSGFASAINALAEDHSRFEDISARAQDRAKSYTIERTADSMLAIYRDLLERRMAS